VRAIALAAITCGLLHALYIVRVGGDFMHGRMLLPSLFGALLPLAVVIPRRAGWQLALGLAVVPWAIVCVIALRAPETSGAISVQTQISDEHSFFTGFSHNLHPVTLRDYRDTAWVRDGLALRRIAARGRAVVLGLPAVPCGSGGFLQRTCAPPAASGPQPPPGQPLDVNGLPRASSPTPVVAGVLNVGMLGYAAGPDVTVVDQYGLADPLGSRIRLLTRGKPGHEKYLPTEWIVARFGARGIETFPGAAPGAPIGIAVARQALGCPPLHRLLSAVDSPLTVSRFFSNIGESFSLASLRFSSDPGTAEREVCGGR
jgi:arabinofuranosyltransferase